jgi:hypothetical protein
MKNPGFIAILICIVSSIGAAQTGDLIRNGGFEEDEDDNGLADHWRFAGDSGVVATWGRNKGYSGQFSQRLTCTSFTSLSPASHAMICQVDTLKLEKGKWYRFSFAARQQGIPGRAVKIAISNTKSWTNCGLQESFRASSKWKKFEYTFRAAETISNHVRLQFWYTSTGSLWLDEVKLEPSEPVVKRFMEVIAPTNSVNLLPNSSFECGISGWGSIADIPGWGGNLNTLVGGSDNTAGKFHSSSFKISLTSETIPVFYFDYFPLYRVPVKAPLLANRGWISVDRNVPYTLSAYMRAGSEGLVGVLSVNQAFRRNLRHQVRLKTNWERCTFTFKPQAEQVFIALGMDLEASKRDGGTVWIDAVQLEKGLEATAYHPRAPIEVGLETARLGNLFHYGREPKFTATVFNAEQAQRHVVLDIQITDFDDAIVHKVAVPVEISGGRKVKVPINSGVQQKGFYRLQLRCQGAGIVSPGSIRFAIIEPYKKSDSLFGMNHAYPWRHLLDLSKQIGICWIRDWSLKWHNVEPEKGRFGFTECDHQINRVLERGLNVLGLLPFPSADWSSSAGPEVKATSHYPESRERIAYMPGDLNDLAGYVRKTIQHYQNRLNVWEILNEPVYTSYALPRGKGYQVKDYVRLLKTAYQSVKAVDADAFVIGGIAGGPATYTREFIEADGLRWIDALNLHAYPGLTSPEAYEEPLTQLREKMRSVGTDKPIWFTEGAYYADDDKPFEPYDSTWLKQVDSEAEAAEWQIKFNTILLAYGTEKIIYHSGTPGSLNNESLSGIFFEWAGAPRKMLVTQAAMANLLSPPLKSLGPIKCPGMIRAYGFESDGRTIIIAWLKEGATTIEISPAEKQWRAVDLQGNEVKTSKITMTGRPVYFIAKGTKLKELPW